jgi:hypothetical protein
MDNYVGQLVHTDELHWQLLGIFLMRLFVFGDSFAANSKGWVSMLNKNIDVEIQNFAQNGVGQYKIFKKIMQNLNFDKSIICYTSPWRIHTRNHPIYKNSIDRPENDFMLNDLAHHSKINKEIRLVYEYIKKYYDFDYQLDIYELLVKELLLLKNTIHITFHEPDDTKKIKNNYNHIWKTYPGDINHMSNEGNRIVADNINKLL